MLFYRVAIKCKTKEPAVGDISIFGYKSTTYYEEKSQSGFVFLIRLSLKNEDAVLCAALEKSVNKEKQITDYLSYVGLEFSKLEFREITISYFQALLELGERNNLVLDRDNLLYKLKIEGSGKYFDNYMNGGFRYRDSIVGAAVITEDLLADSAELSCNKSLNEELARIEVGTKQKGVAGHPVHYLVQADDKDTKTEVINALICALNTNGRLESRRYCRIDIESTSRLQMYMIEEFYHVGIGGTIVFNIEEYQTEDGGFAYMSGDTLTKALEIMKRYQNQVLTIICINSNAIKTKKTIMKNLDGLTIVNIAEQKLFDDDARAFLVQTAKKRKIKPDKHLYHLVELNSGYSPADLHKLFDKWYALKLKNVIYKQYADLDTTAKQIVSEEDKGSSVVVLKKMIGLSEAKTIIHEAIDLFKAQKAFGDKGFCKDPISMHMCFTGNPGTAKTTIARLMAQIMKDNDLLSIGNLHEVSRANLIGKYVGHTAPLVKQAFKEARGSVLFIDEAYSLVEKDGLFGDEAINTMVQEMENMRDEVVVVLAGYPDKMEDLFQKNPGLRSRIGFHVPFHDYSVEQLLEITEFLTESKGLILGKGVRDKLRGIYEISINQKDFGNGRFVRNMVEKAVIKQASRLLKMNPERVTNMDVTTLLGEDFEIQVQETYTPRIGFIA